MKVTANAIRVDGWWAVEIPELGGVHTQARRLDQVPMMVADAAELLGHDPDTVEVEVVPTLDLEAMEAVELAAARAAELRAATSAASAASRAAVSRLQSAGLTMRDMGRLLGISPQRVAQLAQLTK